jgi:hypothetical protein
VGAVWRLLTLGWTEVNSSWFLFCVVGHICPLWAEADQAASENRLRSEYVATLAANPSQASTKSNEMNAGQAPVANSPLSALPTTPAAMHATTV